MKQILLLLLVTITMSAVAQQPFEKYGYKVRVLTLSNGRFSEIHDIDSVVQIGSVLLNVNSKKIIGYVEPDTSIYEADPTLISRWISPDPLSEMYYSHSPYNFTLNNPVRFTDPTGMAVVDDYYFNQQGEVVQQVVTDQPDRFFVQTGEKPNPANPPTGPVEAGTETVPVYTQIDLKNSEVGTMARAVYAEMAGEDNNSKQIVAESIENRTQLPGSTYEHADSYSDAVNTAYDVAKPNDPAHGRFTDPQNSANADHPADRQALVNSVGVAIKVHYGGENVEIGKGVLFYNSSSSTIYDSNKNMQKITLDVKASGIKGAWKLK